MSFENFTLAVDGEGIALLTWDMPGRSMNVFTLEVMDELDRIVTAVTEDEAIKGVVFTSGKDSFSGGADLTMLERLLAVFHAERAKGNEEAAAQRLFDESSRLQRIYRRLETCGKPWVAAINGVCMGGATELALACHARVALQSDKVKIALPEVKVGLFPGAGGTQRVMRMADAQAGLQFLLQGRELRPAQAKGMKLVDEVVPAEQLIDAAKALIENGLDPVKPWDKKGFKLPGGKIYSPQGFQFWPAAIAIYRRETHDNYPAARAIMQSVYEGLQLPMDQALTVESRWFANILQTKEAAAMIRSLFVSMQELNKGARRPAGIEPSRLKKVGVLGAGFMGAGIAYVTAAAGIDVVLIDRDMEAAEKGKAYSEQLMANRVKKGRAKPEAKDALLARITPSADYALLADCDLVVEAVFEERGVKKAVTEAAEAVLPEGTVFASNTSTLPITSLAENSKRPEDFIGIHFFSPVDKMMLVEIILGEKTGDKALAVALDYVRAIRKTPIVVNDTRGFYANRCVGAYLREAHIMVMEGIPAPMVDNAAKLAGMPVGPLTLSDEVALDLIWKIVKAARKDLGEAGVEPRQEALLDVLVEKNERLGRKNGKGFFDYDGKHKHFWPDLNEALGVPVKDAEEIDVDELKERLLAAQALEAARCVEENVVTDVREADVGSILGFGFAPYSGGTLSYIDGIGTADFVAMCNDLVAAHGPRFTPPKLLVEMAEKGETFYGRFPPARVA
ncbi:MAG: 3-hydroxyacyl-CoA dehydrogenase [Hyphomicrobiales bacterium]|nr:MAG: 3-hydroxyacyl-CoA dehydrogenase [Hyphomicrobiales bacterium]